MKRFSEQQPRVPAGQSDGGRWTSGGGSGSSSSPPGARQHRDQIAELIADPINPNNVISDSGPALGLQGREDTAIGQLAQDFPEMGGPMAPPNEDVYRKLLDKIATSRDSGQELTPDDVTRVKITLMADKYVGSGYWSYDVSRRLDGYPPESNKCSLFVAEVLTWNGAGAGYPNAGNYFRHPPNAGQWADPSYVIPGWNVLGGKVKPEPGDVAAQKANFIGAFGHVMIVGTDNTLIGTIDGPNVNPQGVVARIPMKDNIVPLSVANGPIVYRRFKGK